MKQPENIKVGDLVKVCKRGNVSKIEVEYVDPEGEFITGRIPYASTYAAGGQYEGSYRGRATAWFSEVLEKES